MRMPKYPLRWVGQLIEAARLHRNLSQSQQCNLLNGRVSQSTLSRWEAGETIPGAQDLDVVAEIVPGLTGEALRNAELRDRLEAFRVLNEMSDDDLVQFAKDNQRATYRQRVFARRSEAERP